MRGQRTKTEPPVLRVKWYDLSRHVPDPKRTLRRLAEVLKPGGEIRGVTPNVDAWDRRLMGAWWAGWHAPRHFILFDREMLERVENLLHGSLDVTFSEDQSRIRKGNGPEIAAGLRRLALSILKQDTTLKETLRGKRLRAGWNNETLHAILTGTPA